MTTSVFFASSTLRVISSATRFASSSDSMSSTSSVRSPSALASLNRSVSSSSLSLMVNSLFCTMRFVLVSSRSGRSLFTTSASSWSSRPASVTVKLMSVVSAWISGGKCGLDSLVCRYSLNLGLYSTSLSPILTKYFLPLRTVERVTTGMSTASMDSPMFSMSTVWPFSTARSMMVTVLGLPMRTTARSFFASRSFTQAMPCSCGSHISGQRSEFVVMVPFSTDVLSDGRPSPTQPAMMASFTITLSGSTSAVMGAFFSTRYVLKAFTRSTRNLAVKGPQ
mmetsp:Transcript_2470/g.8781  ORF Transcript_2470/g.8781 Transcript_2470/m.8781 type:complete len:280 (-) Transcript_2470:4584-5423(-)